MKRKLLSILLCVSIAAALGGCGSAAPTAAEIPDAAAETADTKAQGGSSSVVYWSMWESTEPQGKAIQAAADQYVADTGNKVDVQFKGRTGIREGLSAALEAGTTIDLFDEDIDRVNGTWGQYLMDLEDLSKKNEYEATANESVIAACREVGGGKLMSIPYQPNIFAFFYNADLLKEAGVTAAPTTWEEFLAVCEKVKAAGYIPLTCDDAYITHMFGYHMSRLVGEPAVEGYC